MGRSALLCLGLAALVLAAFRPLLDAGFVNWDDPLIVVDNARFRGLSPAHLRWMLTTFHGGHWEPLAWLSLAVDHALFGLSPRAFHATNLALHAANAVLVFAVARLTAPPPAKLPRAAAAAAAALFAVHPLRVESVAWVVERRDLLATLLTLAAVLLWLRRARGAGRGALLGSYACFALSLCARAAGLAWPLVLLVLDVWPLRRARALGWRAVLLEKVPYVLLALAAAVPALRALAAFGATEMGGALSTPQRLAQAAYGLAFYPARTLLPLGLSPLYLLDLELEPLSPRYILSALAVLAASAGAWAARRRAPALAAAWLAYALLIAPFLGLASNGIHLAADRYSYAACLPFALLGGAALERWGRRAPRAALAAGLALLLTLSALTFRQARVWRDSESLWTRVVAVEPASYVGWTKLGLARASRGASEQAIADLTRAIELRPAYQPAYMNRGILRGASDPAAALPDLDRAVALRPGDPLALMNRGAARLATGDARGAAADFDAALAAAPADWPLRALAERRAAEARARPSGPPR
jgi:tetratricopeptide (TPR) repeat protein